MKHPEIRSQGDYVALRESRHVFHNCKASLGGAIHAAGRVAMMYIEPQKSAT